MLPPSSRDVRPPILAGTWYPSEGEVLERSIREFLRGAGRPDAPARPPSPDAVWQASGPVRAVVVPHAGHQYSGACAGAAFAQLASGEDLRIPPEIDRIVLLGPSHHVPFRGIGLPVEDVFATPLGELTIDRDAVESLLSTPGASRRPDAHRNEHCLEIELPFLQLLADGRDDLRIVPILAGHLDEELLEALARAITALWTPRTLLLVSTDFTHYGAAYGYVPFMDPIPEQIEALDRGALAAVLEGNDRTLQSYVERTGATICGIEPLRLFLRAAGRARLSGRLLEYYRSGDQNGDFGTSVSYAALAFRGDADRSLTDAERLYLLELARAAIRSACAGRPAPAVPVSELEERFGSDSPVLSTRGCFVTLRTDEGELRGCIGSVEPSRALVFDLIENARSAAARDPRFPMLTPDEEPRVRIEVSILSPMRRVGDPGRIELGLDGVLMERRGRRALFLPDVATEQGWDLESLLRELAHKADLPPDEIAEADLFSFRTTVLEERP